MLSKQAVLDALGHLVEPESKRSMTELNLVTDVVIKEKDVYMTMAMSDSNEAAVGRIREEASSALLGMGIDRVHIRFRAPVVRERPGPPHIGTMHKTPAEPVPVPGKDTIFLTIASGKGGVGKSTVTANLARALAGKGKKVGLLDADIYGYSIPAIMGIRERPSLDGEMIIPVEASGVKVASMGFFSEDNAPVVWRGPQLGKMLRTFFTLVKWGDLDYMLIDLPPGTGDVPLDLHAILPQSKEIIVTTPHINALHVAVRAGELARKTKHEVVGVVENMSYMMIDGKRKHIFGTKGGERLAGQLNTKLLSSIPLEPSYEESPELYMEGTYLFHESSQAGQLFGKLAGELIITMPTSV
ncbi:Mrp/NBP35 family ATP-binding protein [Paenibacillus sp. sptzw28]|uniref:Mrp/NBP35 family ATP-binding protein n=1 Tax=Paenibacillus sp. sptzw28 TaxID=715179 RepID=UPI001C6EC800|nr:Mrp/NBP35 family ATP-binding protein [Paenibacillus sp. sptzw28]QYR21456.1 Mrp/NBP35 family ATP-binding protein [Paenibacillus sp. sptzw28]